MNDEISPPSILEDREGPLPAAASTEPTAALAPVEPKARRGRPAPSAARLLSLSDPGCIDALISDLLLESEAA